MRPLNWFIKGDKDEPMKNETSNSNTKKKKHNSSWTVDQRKCLNLEELKRLRRFCDKAKDYGLENKKFARIRNWFMIELGLNAGLRVDEMASLKCGNLIIDKDRSSITVIGKGDKKRAVWISSSFKETCQTYLGYKNDFGYSSQSEDYLLNNLKGNKISKRALQKFFKRIIKEADLSEHYYIHCLRHTYATSLLGASNNDYRFVQQQLGHESITTTQVYASVIESKGREALEQLYKK